MRLTKVHLKRFGSVSAFLVGAIVMASLQLASSYVEKSDFVSAQYADEIKRLKQQLKVKGTSTSSAVLSTVDILEGLFITGVVRTSTSVLYFLEFPDGRTFNSRDLFDLGADFLDSSNCSLTYRFKGVESTIYCAIGRSDPDSLEFNIASSNDV